jgi:hypothetical protein
MTASSLTAAVVAVLASVVEVAATAVSCRSAFSTSWGVGLCGAPFIVGVGVRLKRWFQARVSEASRRKRLEVGHISVGAPERVAFGARPRKRV